jgi:hypothetical protein
LLVPRFFLQFTFAVDLQSILPFFKLSPVRSELWHDLLVVFVFSVAAVSPFAVLISTAVSECWKGVKGQKENGRYDDFKKKYRAWN